MSIEAGVVLGAHGEPLYWHTPAHRSSVALPDSRELWDVLWKKRRVLAGFAHSHPGSGMPAPSETDLTTFAAVEAGLGKRLNWWILSADHYVLYHYESGGYVPLVYDKIGSEEEGGTLLVPEWMFKLRRASEYPTVFDRAVFSGLLTKR